MITSYNNLGEATSYSDATGNVTIKNYDLDGRVTSLNDGKGTTNYTFDGGGEYRGVATKEDIGVSGSPSAFAATYDAAGNMATESYPNGLVATRHYDNAGDLTSLIYAKSGSTWMNFTQSVNALAQITRQSSPQSSQVFAYDPADRLISVQDTYQGACTTRVYAFDAHSNRTGLTSYPGTGANGATCATSTPVPSTTNHYDDADRLTSDTAGTYVYDNLGRATSVPSDDARGIGAHASTSGAASIGYYANDMVASEQQGSATDTFTLDPDQNRVTTETQNAATTTNHYSDDLDSPTWSSTSASTWTRNLVGIDGSLAATADQGSTVTLQLTNPHGDIIARSSDLANATSIDSYSESTEYGEPRNPSGAFTQLGWLGTKQRSTDDLAGLTLMGVRLYNPMTGNFLSKDPVEDGNPNGYMYPDDPTNNTDVTGKTNNVTGHHCTWTHCDFRYSNTRALREANMLNAFAYGLGGVGLLTAVFGFAGGPVTWLIGAIAAIGSMYFATMAYRLQYLVHRYHRGVYFRLYYWGEMSLQHQ